ncbi:hypothetical protein [Hyphomicrobium sp. CS1GBMeth3]|uniref:hypothetical protein n=1 Tax=Hyphomicrobium sp. CS1GBMeth3 TaxID=1892845 RepID=UPI0009316413|nr:hypothetical protein [Hyphomicrobium sp. CS1GBMeth3]
MVTLLRPADLDQIASESEWAKMDEERKLQKKKEQQQLDLRDAFMARDVHPEVFERINQAVSIAAQRGAHQIQVMTFPSSYCSDGGRRINIADPEWPSTLQGFALKAYEFFNKELRPHGYKLHAEIISFPGGMPGEVGLFLKW